MAKYKISKGDIASVSKRKSPIYKSFIDSYDSVPPPLSTDSYAFTSNKIVKKQKSAQNTLHEAERLVASELGYSPRQKKKSIFFKY